MLKQNDMTTAAACFFEVLPDGVFSVSDAVALSGLSLPRCQLLLIQFSLVGLLKDCGIGERFKRL